jgi:hypothetical protein
LKDELSPIVDRQLWDAVQAEHAEGRQHDPYEDLWQRLSGRELECM